MSARSLWKRVCTIASWTFLSRILGLLRDRFMGAAFGASLLLDAFYVAFALPNMFRNLFGEGALSSAFIPRYAQMREKDPAQAEAFAGLVITRLSILLSCFAAIGMLICGGLMLWGTNEKAILVAVLAVAQLPYLILICVSAIMAGMLNVRSHFAVPAAAPIILNVFMIACVLWWEDVYLLPYAILCTGIFQLLLHVAALRFTGSVPKARLQTTEDLKEMRRALMPTLIASGVFQFNAFLDAIIAYEFIEDATGAVVILYFANRLLQFPLALIAHGVGTAAYPEISKAAMGGYEQTGAVLLRVNRLLLALVVPAATGLFLVAEPLSRVIYQAGAFTDESVLRVVAVTHIYAIGLLPIAFSKIFVRAFHAHRDQRSPMFIALLGVAVNLALNIVFVTQTDLQERGLALASVISSFLMVFLYAIGLYRRGVRHLLSLEVVVKVLLASVTMAAAVYGLQQYWSTQGSDSLLEQGMHLGVLVAVGAVVYGLCLLKSVKRWRVELKSGSD